MGIYIPGNSILHRLDARVKLICLAALIGALIYTNSLPGYGIMAVLTFVLVTISGLDLKTACAPLQRVLPFFAVIFFMNALFNSQGAGPALWSWWIFNLSTAGMAAGANVVLKLILLMILFHILMSTTAPMKITAALVSLLRPLGWLRLPVADLALMISVALQFIPTLMEETEMIRMAQTARGARFDSPRLRDKAESIMPLVIPIFISAFKRADELALAMEARGYRGGRPQAPKTAGPLERCDFAAMLVVAAICGLQIFAL
jgi:energy-coupling factor transport system permease protein